jgi:hypothetical protein
MIYRKTKIANLGHFPIGEQTKFFLIFVQSKKRPSRLQSGENNY